MTTSINKVRAMHWCVINLAIYIMISLWMDLEIDLCGNTMELRTATSFLIVTSSPTLNQIRLTITGPIAMSECVVMYLEWWRFDSWYHFPWHSKDYSRGDDEQRQTHSRQSPLRRDPEVYLQPGPNAQLGNPNRQCYRRPENYSRFHGVFKYDVSMNDKVQLCLPWAQRCSKWQRHEYEHQHRWRHGDQWKHWDQF